MSTQTIDVTFFSDFICPWCYIAERRLADVAQEEGFEVRLHFKPYELNPDMPKQGLNRKAYRSAKFGSWERSLQLDAGTIQASIHDPVDFNYEAMEFTPNTRDAHRLVWYVQQSAPEKEGGVVDAVLRAYFSLGKNIGDRETLVGIASDAGLDRGEVLAFLESDEGNREVELQERSAVEMGLQGVPHIQIGEHQLHGAESSENMRKALRDYVAMHTAPTAGSGGA